MKQRTDFLRIILCAGVCFALDFLVVPNYLMRGVPDLIWMILMVVLPMLATVLILGDQKPGTVFWSMGFQLLLVTVLCKPIGMMLGLRLESLEWDLFEFLQYFQFAWGWIIAGAGASYFVLRLRSKKHNKRPPTER